MLSDGFAVGCQQHTSLRGKVERDFPSVQGKADKILWLG